MSSPQLALCAALAACAVTTAPAYGGDARGAGTTAVSVTPARSAAAPADPAARRDGPPRGGASRELAPGETGSLARGASAERAAGDGSRTGPAAQVTQRGELSSTSAVGLVLAGGAVLVIAGQLLRLRLRLRRERRGEADER
ncbi:hypothetical protein ACWD6P_34270 [Streptomyces sp. NPDC002446]